MSESQVYRRKVVVKAEQGLHIRPCTAVAQLAMKYQSRVKLSKDNASPVDAKSILDLMTLAAGPNAELELEVEGPDAAEALEHLAALFEADFVVQTSPAASP